MVDEHQIIELPLNGRSYDQLISLKAGTVLSVNSFQNQFQGFGQQFSIGGGRFTSNKFLSDGTEIAVAQQLGSTPGSVAGTNLGVEAIREFSVLTSNFNVSYGKASGGIINIVTKSGTNQWQGSLFEFHRNDDLDARNFFDQTPSPPEFKRNNFGGSGGGPLIHNKTFVFGSYEGLRERLGVTNVALVPDDNAREGILPEKTVTVSPKVKPFLDLFPRVTGRNFGDGTGEAFNSSSRSADEDFFLTRLDHQFASDNSFFGKYQFSDSRLTQPDELSVFGTAFSNRTQVLTLEDTHTFSAGLVNTARFGFSRSSTEFGPTVISGESAATAAALPPFVPGQDQIGVVQTGLAGTFSAGGRLNLSSLGGTADVRFFAVNLFEGSNQMLVTTGPHSLKFGVQYQRIQRNEDQGSTKLGLFRFASLEDLLRAQPTFFQGQAPGSNSVKGSRMNFVSLYGKDEIQLASTLKLTLGLRWEVLTSPDEVNDRISNFVATAPNAILATDPLVGEPLFNTSFGNFQPRIGLAWDPFGNGKTAVRAGFGMFHNQLDLDPFFFFGNNPPFARSIFIENGLFPNSFDTPTGEIQIAPTGVERDLLVPTRLQWNLQIQQELANDMVVKAGYVGARGYHLTRSPECNNALPTEILPDGRKFFAENSPRRNPDLGNELCLRSDANSFYQALQTELRKRFSQGLRFDVSYTLAKNIDEASAITSGSQPNSNAQTMDPDDISRDRGRSDFDVRHTFVFNLTYDLPLGSGRGLDLSGAADKLLGGWQVSTIITAASGPPFTAQTGFNRARNRQDRAADRPNLASGASNNPILGTPDQFFDPTAFVLPEPGTFGNVGRNTLGAPAFTTVDISLVKETAVTENVRVQFRSEFFNILNQANFSIPDRLVFNPDGTSRASAGRISSTTSTSRQIQFGLKILF